MGPAENNVVDAEFYQKQENRDSVLIVPNINKYVVDDFIDNFLVGHRWSIGFHNPKIEPKDGY